MKKGKKQTWKRQLIAIGCKTDFGLGKGVIAEETVVYRDDRGWGFKTAMFARRLIEDEYEMIKRYVKVEANQVKSKARGKR